MLSFDGAPPPTLGPGDQLAAWLLAGALFLLLTLT